MARRKEYDRDVVLKKATDLFWEKGFKATSISDIVTATGLNTASMYQEFGDKSGLFEEALGYYQDNILGQRLQILIDQPNLTGIYTFLDDVVKGTAEPQFKGCLMMNHLAQQNSISKKASRRISKFNDKMESLVETALINAQQDGKLGPNKDPRFLASYIMFCVHGLTLYGRHANKKPSLHDLQQLALHALS